MDTIYDCIVVGGGPAGLSAAIYVARYNRSVIVADHADGRSTTPEINENYLGFPDGVASRALREHGRRQASRFGAQFAQCKVEEIAREDGIFTATAGVVALRGRTLILATGVRDYLPEFDNADPREYFGRSLFWCITCDGYKVRGARVAVVGATDSAATTALQFLNFTDRLCMITNRRPGEAEISDAKRGQLDAAGIALYESSVACIEGDAGMMRTVTLDDGRIIELDFMFNQQGSRPNSLLARSLGVACDEAGYVMTDNEQRTNVERVYAAGDLTKPFAHQIVTAAHEGATAGQAANYDLYRPEQREG
jgi:thioredoxin reductase (NADPH)